MNVEPEPSQMPSISRCNRQRLSEYFLVHHCTLVAPLSPGHALSSPSVTSPSGVVLTLVAQWMSRRMRLSAMRAFSSAVAWAKARPSPANAELNDAVRVPRMMESTTMTTSSSISEKPAADLGVPFANTYGRPVTSGTTIVAGAGRSKRPDFEKGSFRDEAIFSPAKISAQIPTSKTAGPNNTGMPCISAESSFGLSPSDASSERRRYRRLTRARLAAVRPHELERGASLGLALGAEAPERLDALV